MRNVPLDTRAASEVRWEAERLGVKTRRLASAMIMTGLRGVAIWYDLWRRLRAEGYDCRELCLGCPVRHGMETGRLPLKRSNL